MEKLVEIFVPRTSGSIVLDPFAGSGTTLVAAKNFGLDYVGVEVEGSYVEIIEKRLAESTGLQQKLALC
jgi:site-specific DNA-methyltransferase (adenine-specific)